MAAAQMATALGECQKEYSLEAGYDSNLTQSKVFIEYSDLNSNLMMIKQMFGNLNFLAEVSEERDRWAGRQSDRQTHRQTDRQTDRQTERDRERNTDRQTETDRERLTDRQRQTEKD